MNIPILTGADKLVPSFANVMMENLSDLIIIMDLLGRFIHANKTAIDHLGYTKDELVKGGPSLILAEPDVQALRRHLSDIADGRGPKIFGISATNKAGKRLNLEAVMGPLVVSERVTGIWFRAKDITERKQFEVELEETKNFIEKVITSLEEGLVTVDRNGAVLSWSAATEQILQISAKDMMGRTFYTILKDDTEKRRFVNRLKEVVTGRPVTDMEYTHIDRNDRAITLSITSSPLQDHQGRVREIVLVIRDLSEKKHLEARLKESEKRLATEVIKKIEDLKYIEQLNRIVVEYMEEGALLLDAKLDVGFVNPKLVNLLGYKFEELIGKPLKIIVPEDLLWVWNEIPDRAKRGSFRFESSILRKDGEEVPVMVTASSIKIETRKVEFLCTVIDLSEQKAKDEKMREEMMEFKLKAGNVYLLLEKGYGKALDVLLTLKRFGHRSIIVSRRSNRDELTDLIKDTDSEVFWLEEKGRGIWALPPTKAALSAFIEKKVDRTKVLLMDRLDYLSSVLGFQGMLDVIHGLVDIFYHRKAILVLLVDPSHMTQAQIGQLEKDASIVEAKRAVILPEDLQDLLVYIYQQNRMSIEPSYTEIGKRFNITKTTTRKRVQQLSILDLVLETKRGRTKVLRVSDKGSKFVPSKAG